MRSHFLSLLGLFAASAVAGMSESQLRVMKHLHGEAFADFARYGYAEAKEAPVVEARDDSKKMPHSFLNDKTERKLPHAISG